MCFSAILSRRRCCPHCYPGSPPLSLHAPVHVHHLACLSVNGEFPVKGSCTYLSCSLQPTRPYLFGRTVCSSSWSTTWLVILAGAILWLTGSRAIFKRRPAPLPPGPRGCIVFETADSEDATPVLCKRFPSSDGVLTAKPFQFKEIRSLTAQPSPEMDRARPLASNISPGDFALWPNSRYVDMKRSGW